MSETSGISLGAVNSSQTNRVNSLIKCMIQLSKALPRQNVITSVLFLVSILQLLFVSRHLAFTSLFDVSPILNLLTLPFHDVDFLPVSPTLLLMLIAAPVLLVGGLVVLMTLATSIHSGLLVKFTRCLGELLTTILFIPFLSFFLSFLPCSVTSFGEPSFTPSLTSSFCSSGAGILIRIAAFILSIILILLAFFWLCMLDDNHLSKRVFACSHTRSHLRLLLTKVVILVSFFLFHHRYWVFRTIYLFGSLYVSFVFYKFMPFYRRDVNLKVVGLLGIWTGNAVAFYIYSIVDQFISPGAIFNSSVFYGCSLVFAGAWFLLAWFRANRYENILDKIDSHFRSSGIIDEDSKLDVGFRADLLDLGSSCPKTPYQLDLITRGIGIKPTSSPYLATVTALFQYGELLFPESPLFFAMKLNFEINILKDHVAACVTFNNLKAIDLDFKFDEQYLSHKISHQLEQLRRLHSTGMTVDSTSFIHFQRQQKELSSLHKLTLEGLWTFWQVLASESVNLSVLPDILNRVQTSKRTLETMLQRLFQQHGDQRVLLEFYATFAKDIECDEEKSLLLLEQANLMNDSDHSSSAGGSSVASGLASQKDRKGSKRKFRLRSMSTMVTSSDKPEKSAIRNLKYAVTAALIIMFCLFAGSFFLSSTFLSETEKTMLFLFEGSHADFFSQYLGSTIFQSFLQSDDVTFPSRILRHAEHVSFHLKRLVLPDSGDANVNICSRSTDDLPSSSLKIRDSLTENRFAAFSIHEFIPQQESANVISFWTLGLRHAHICTMFARNLLFATTSTSLVKTISNSLLTVSSSVNFFYDFMVETASLDFSRSVFFQIVFSVAILLIILLIGFGLFAKSFHKISEERQSILNLFLYIPKQEIQQILSDTKFDFLRKNKSPKNNDLSIIDDSVMSDEETSSYNHLRAFKSDSVHLDIPSPSQEINQEIEEEEVKQSNEGISLTSKLILIVWIVSLVVLILFSVFFFFQMDDSITKVFEEFDLAVQARSTAGVTTITDRRLSTYIQLFTGFGDQFFLTKYFDIINSGYRENLLRNILQLRLTNEELSSLSTGNTWLNEVKYLESISLSLLPQVYEIEEYLSENLPTSDYNIDGETVAFRRKLEYPTVTNWYTNKSHDVTLPKDDLLALIRHTICSPRWLDINSKLMSAIEGTTNMVVASRTAEIENLLRNFEDLIGYQNAILTAIVIVFLLIIPIFFVNRNKLRFGKIFIFLCFIFSIGAILLIISLNFTITKESKEVNSISSEAIKIFNFVIQTEWFFHGIKRTSQIMAYEFIDYYARFSGRLVQLDGSLETLKAKSLCQHSVFKGLCDSMASQATSIQSQLPPILRRINISAKIKLNILGKSVSGLNDVEWTPEDTQGDAWELPNNLRLDSTASDLAQDEEYKNLLSMGLVSTRQYEAMIDTTANSFQSLRLDAINQVTDAMKSIVENSNYLILIGIICLFGIMTFSIALTIAFFIGGAPKEAEKSHIKQRIKIASIEKYTRHYVGAILGLLAVLLLFFAVSVVSFTVLSGYPKVFALTGQRSSLVPFIVSQLAQGCVSTSNSQQFYNFASQAASQLLEVHSELVLSKLATGTDQNSLLFDTNYHDQNRFYSNSTDNYGMHSLLVYFVDSVQKFSRRELDTNSDCFGTDFDEILVAGETLGELTLDSVDHFFSFIMKRRTVIYTSMFVIFAVFVFLLLFCYIFIFRTMLISLEQEESTTVGFLDVLSDKVIGQVSTIRNFLAMY
ncbi:hypothetical protein RCL1_001088 [Eukaryota sp. TZLM3-RCL]